VTGIGLSEGKRQVVVVAISEAAAAIVGDGHRVQGLKLGDVETRGSDAARNETKTPSASAQVT
jgi:hypothetical protein